MKPKHRIPTVFSAAVAVLLSALVCALSPTAWAGVHPGAPDVDAVLGLFGGPGLSVCERTAEIAVYVCRQELNADNLLSAAKAYNLEDEQQRQAALQEIARNRHEGAIECFEKLEARRELCETLEEDRYDPQIDPANFVHPIAEPNPYFPLVPGTRYIYEGESEEGSERVEVTVTDQTREILGVTCTLVTDQVFVDGELLEDTRDYYAQDLEGNVWYFGETTVEMLEGDFLNIDGSWRAGVDGAQPGVIMPADPEVGDAYRQEFLLDEAEDAAEILSLDEEVETPLGTFSNCRQTAEFTPIEPDVLEHKFYAPGVGFVLQINVENGERVELVEVIPPGS